MSKYFVCGIGTDVGKTLVSAVLVELLGADYWKPVQAGSLEHTDTDEVRRLVSSNVTFYPEIYATKLGASPHYSAKLDGVSINLDEINLPRSENKALIVEAAGGVMVPLNDKQLILDLMIKLKLPIVLVASSYLGSINHTLLTIEVIKSKGIEIKGILFNGVRNEVSEKYILSYTGVKLLGCLPQVNELTKEAVKKLTKEITL